MKKAAAADYHHTLTERNELLSKLRFGKDRKMHPTTVTYCCYLSVTRLHLVYSFAGDAADFVMCHDAFSPFCIVVRTIYIIFKICSWYVTGIRALIGNHPDRVETMCREHDLDVLCPQETKVQEMHVDDKKMQIRVMVLQPEYTAYYSCLIPSQEGIVLRNSHLWLSGKETPNDVQSNLWCLIL
jgi:hypothetical protein